MGEDESVEKNIPVPGTTTTKSRFFFGNSKANSNSSSHQLRNKKKRENDAVYIISTTINFKEATLEIGAVVSIHTGQIYKGDHFNMFQEKLNTYFLSNPNIPNNVIGAMTKTKPRWLIF